jgi:hypothetical protein
MSWQADAFDVGFEVFTAGAGARAGDSIRGFGNDGLDGFLFLLVVMRRDRVDHLRVHAIAFAIFCAEQGVCAFLVVIHGFADIMQEAALF